MTRMVQCVKLKKEAEGLVHSPLPGELGQKIYEQISHEAWQLWLAHQTILINEYRLSMLDPKAHLFLAQEMNHFLFGTADTQPLSSDTKAESST
jgi:Fe-S cluster biosynthesis and repair protein YggX